VCDTEYRRALEDCNAHGSFNVSPFVIMDNEVLKQVDCNKSLAMILMILVTLV